MAPKERGKRRKAQDTAAEKENAGVLKSQSLSKNNGAVAPKNGCNFTIGAKHVGRRSKHVGKLSLVLELPVDVFSEIAANLHPRDVLNLARAAKRFNELLMSKQSRPIWRAAFAKIDAPKCPEDLSEPRYAALLFDNHCNACGAVTKREPSYVLRLRVCRRCPSNPISIGYIIFKQFCQREKIEKPPPGHVLPALVPHKEPKFTNANYSGTDTQKEIHFYLCALASKNFCTKDFERVAKEYFAIEKKGKSLESPELRKFIEDRMKKVEEIEKSAEEMKKWAEDCAEEMLYTKETKIEEFHNAVYERLEELGYTLKELREMQYAPEDDISGPWNKYVNQPKELTDRIWKGLRPKLVNLIEQMRLIEHAVKVTERRGKVNKLLCNSINTAGKQMFEAQQADLPLTIARRRNLFVPVFDANELGCVAVNEFIKSKEEDASYDNIQTLPEAEWNKLVEKDIVESFDERRDFLLLVLSYLLVEGATRVDDDLLNACRHGGLLTLRTEIQLPPCFSVFHAAGFLYCTNFVLNYPGEKSINAYNCVFTYEDVIRHCGKKPSAFIELVIGMREWMARAQEGGAKADINKWLQFGWSHARRCPWEGSREGVEVAMILLRALGYDGAKCESPDCKSVPSDPWVMEEHLSCEGIISMMEMEAKGKVFVCMLCPEEYRCKRSWKELVQHYFREIFMFKEWKKRREQHTKYVSTHISKTSRTITLCDSASPPVIEDASYEENTGCPYDKEHEHDDSQDESRERVRYTCAICREDRMFPCESLGCRRCVEVHVRVCHRITDVKPRHVLVDRF